MAGTTAFSDHAREALTVLRGHRLRSVLVILGVAIGVTTLMAMVSILIGLSRKITRDIRSSENVVVRLAKFGIVVHGDRELFLRPNISVLDWRAIKDELLTVKTALYLEGDQPARPLLVHFGDEKSNLVQVFGTGPEFLRVYSIPLVAGRYLTEEDVWHARRVCVLGFGPLTDLFPLIDPIGKRVRVGQVEYTVVGAMAERNSFVGRLADNFVAIPYTAYRKDFARQDQTFSAVDMVPAPGVTAEQMSDDVRALMRARRGLRPGDEDDFDLLSQDQVQQLLDKITTPVGAALLVIASIGLMVGGIGVMAIMLVSVTERTKEVGVRLALGARRKDILWQFLVEAAMLTGLGGAVGVIGGLGAAYLVQATIGLPASTPIGWVATSIALSTAVGIVFGLYPANRAARLDPIEAMRAE